MLPALRGPPNTRIQTSAIMAWSPPPRRTMMPTNAACHKLTQYDQEPAEAGLAWMHASDEIIRNDCVFHV